MLRGSWVSNSTPARALRELSGIYTHRRFLLSLVRKELTVRYHGSVLGIFWSLATPLFLMVVYRFVFGVLYQRSSMPNYHIYLLVGILPWTFFSISLSNSVGSFLANQNLVTKVYFPRSLVPISVCLSQMINFLLSLLPLALFMLLGGMDFSTRLVYLPAIMAIHLVMAAGLAMLLSVAFVFFRDIQHLLETGLLAWFFISPIIYTVADVKDARPELWAVLQWNPMAPLLELYHGVLYDPSYHALPLSSAAFGLALLFAAVFFLIGLWVLCRCEGEMLKVL